MASHSSASMREHTPHANPTTRTATVSKRHEAGLKSVTSEGDQTVEPHGHDSSREKIEALADIICGAGEEAAGALLVLMGQMENSDHPQAIAHTVKHFAFTRCGEFNLRGMVDTHIATLEGELWRGIIQPKSAFTTEMES